MGSLVHDVSLDIEHKKEVSCLISNNHCVALWRFDQKVLLTPILGNISVVTKALVAETEAKTEAPGFEAN